MKITSNIEKKNSSRFIDQVKKHTESALQIYVICINSSKNAQGYASLLYRTADETDVRRKLGRNHRMGGFSE